MIRRRLAFFVLALTACGHPNKKADPAQAAAPASTPTPAYLTEIRQLTFNGTRAGEGYFSPDGRRMIFQSEREPGNPFYQMYVMDLQTGGTVRVSPGHGKTSCGWIHPDGKHVLFASTHADPEWKKKQAAEIEERKNPKQRYSWSFDDAYEIYQADADGKGHYKNLTNAKGYDAEGSYSPDGKWIAFASNRAGYDKNLSEADKQLFAKDPSYLMDIYIMRADGTQVKRLTTEAGYDGGPFFSPDGKRITYRHFTPDGRSAEVYTMNVDGSDKKQLTRLGNMSWAPFYHPTGDYLIFASNKYGHANFELFAVDRDGKQEPVRVTELPGFDGLPAFTPDGGTLVWSHTNEKGEAQLFRAKWNNGLVREALKIGPGVPTTADARRWIEYLASPEFDGRMTGNPREAEYVDALVQAFGKMGLKTEVQTYEFTSGLDLGPKNTLTIGDQQLKLQEAWLPMSFAKSGAYSAAPLAFVGYGLSAPAAPNQPAFDSYEGMDVKGKWVVLFSGLPENVSNERRFYFQIYARLQHKAIVARNKGAVGLIVIEDATTPAPAMKVRFEGRAEDAGLPVVRLTPAAADALFGRAKQTRAEWTRKLANGTPGGFEFTDVTAAASIDLQFKKAIARNVLALLKAPNATETVVVGAHLDHLGHGEMGNSLAPQKALPHVGADDNASGVAGVLAIADALKTAKLKRNVLFGLWTGEEIGILGSAHFAQTTKYKLSSSLNLDMIGRYREQLLVQGTGSATGWKGLVEQVGTTSPLKITTQDDPYLPSDALTFYMKGLPSVMLFTGSHSQYHTPDDKPDTINYDGLVKIAEFATKLTARLATDADLTYRKVEADPKAHPSRGMRLYLGTIPDYARELPRGVAITGTSKDSPAEKAGLVAGDIILELGGMKIQNLNDYVFCLQALKANEKTKMRILRAGQERDLEITPLPKSL